MNKKISCKFCGKLDLTKNTIGINKKILGDDIVFFLCIECLADYLCVTVSELNDKIEEFKTEGCILFS